VNYHLENEIIRHFEINCDNDELKLEVWQYVGLQGKQHYYDNELEHKPDV
jgi:hypothetical protein